MRTQAKMSEPEEYTDDYDYAELHPFSGSLSRALMYAAAAVYFAVSAAAFWLSDSGREFMLCTEDGSAYLLAAAAVFIIGSAATLCCGVHPRRLRLLPCSYLIVYLLRVTADILHQIRCGGVSLTTLFKIMSADICITLGVSSAFIAVQLLLMYAVAWRRTE